MAKIIDYPRASLRAALLLAEAVDGFAGSCSIDLAAEKLGRKVSGAFSAQISATVKYGLIESKGGRLTTSPLYRNYKLAYTPEEASKYLKEALLLPPLFNSIYERFKSQRLPIAHFEKMLIREFNVPDDIASRVSIYFLEGAKQAGLLNSENYLVTDSDVVEPEPEIVDDESLPLNVSAQATKEDDTDLVANDDTQRGASNKASVLSSANVNVIEDYWLNIRGPGMNFSIEIKDLDDIEIVQVMLRKVQKALSQAGNSAS